MRVKLLFLVVSLFALAPAAWSAPRGEELYELHCEACHGIRGEGGVGIPLALPSFLQNTPDEYLARTIRNGRPGRVMPSFNTLSDAQVNAIVGFIRSWVPGEPPAYTTARIKGDVKRGGELFAERCAVCHGENGEGGKGTGVTFSRPRNLPIIAPALRNEGFLASVTDQMIKHTLSEGRKGTPMSSFLKMGLVEQDIDDLVAYVRSFEHMIEQDRQRQPTPVDTDTEAATLVYESPYPFDETVRNVEDAAVGANFRLIRTQLFEEGLVEPGQENEKKKIIYFCNFNIVDQALAIDPRVGLFLPCSITVIERDGQVYLMTVNPSTLSRHFNNAELDRICAQMKATYKSIMEEATL